MSGTDRMMSGLKMWGTELFGILILVTPIFAIAALIKHRRD